MPYLNLTLSNFSSSFGVGDTMREGWRANWKTEMGWRQSLKLSNGTDLADAQGWLNLKTGDLEAGRDKAIGALSYYPASDASVDGVIDAQPDTYYVEVVLTEPQLLRLIDLERQGYGPTGVSVEVPKLRYGNFPDGSDKNWELGEQQNWLAIEGITFTFTEPDEAEGTVGELPVESRPSGEVQAIRTLGNEIGKVMAWVIGLLALVAIVLIAK
jgi:hypothetical protein